MSDEPETPDPAEPSRQAKLLDSARAVLADDTASDECKEIAREILRQAGVAYS